MPDCSVPACIVPVGATRPGESSVVTGPSRKGRAIADGIVPAAVPGVVKRLGNGRAAAPGIVPAKREPAAAGNSGGGFSPALRCSSGQTDVTLAAYGSPSHGLAE